MNSVSKRSAIFTKLDHQDNLSEPGESSIGRELHKNQSRLGQHFYLFMLLLASGCRYHEVQTIQANQITSSGQVLVKGKKGSNDRFISCESVTDYLLKCKAEGLAPFRNCHINSSNRLLKQFGLITQKKGRVRLTVSGIFREAYAKSIREVSIDDSKVSEFLGHKSKSNSQYYGKG